MTCDACGSSEVYLALSVEGSEVAWWCFPCTWTWRPELELHKPSGPKGPKE